MSLATKPATVHEFAKYATVGVISNAALFLLYLLLVRTGMGPKTAATLAYAIGVLQTFVFNRRWSFRDRGAVGPALVRYIAIYAFGYLFNMAVLVVFVDHAGFPHEWVQGCTILALAVMLFVLQKLWVFRDKWSEAL